MCLAIFKPANVEIKLSELESGFNANRDGAGFAYVEGGKIHIKKGYFKWDDFLKAYIPHEKKQMLIHFRLATHGAEDAFNCHPWPCADGKFAVIHNGILSYPSSAEKSDTGHFVDEVLDPILSKDPDMIRNVGVSWLIEESIGTGNKIVILREDGKYNILNEKQGLWHEGAWFSNTCFRGYGHYWQQKGGLSSVYGQDDEWWEERYGQRASGNASGTTITNPPLSQSFGPGTGNNLALRGPNPSFAPGIKSPTIPPSEIETTEDDDPFKSRLTQEEIARFDWLTDLFPFLFEAHGCATLEEADRVVRAMRDLYKQHNAGAENMDDSELEQAMSKDGYAEHVYETIPKS